MDTNYLLNANSYFTNSISISDWYQTPSPHTGTKSSNQSNISLYLDYLSLCSRYNMVQSLEDSLVTNLFKLIKGKTFIFKKFTFVLQTQQRTEIKSKRKRKKLHQNLMLKSGHFLPNQREILFHFIFFSFLPPIKYSSCLARVNYK